jgi:2-polyprenyl-3-methyl-5-hydroxy-6-metoxy-1,4-benzoquinol methylase
VVAWSDEEWERAYGSGGLDHFDGLSEMARSAVVAGYLRAAGRPLRILDVGCGMGSLVPHLHPALIRRYLGIDPSRAAIARASRHAGGAVELRVGTVADVKGPFDAVVLNEVLTMVADPSSLVDAVGERLADDGLVATSICRHAGDAALWALLDRRFTLRDAVVIHSEATTIALEGWRVALHGHA